jgi:hypothetical protein
MLNKRLVTTLAALFFLLLAGAIVWRQTRWQRNFHRHKAQISSTLWNGARPLCVLFGDSHVEAGKWDELCHGPYGLRNCGHGGAKIEHIQQIVEAIPDSDIEIAVLMCGINNIGRGEPVDSCFKRFNELLSVTREKLQPRKILVVSVMPLRQTNEQMRDINAAISELNSRLKAMCLAANATFVDLTGVVAKPDGGLSEKLTSDGLHLNDQGYRAIASTLCQFLTPK